MKLRLAVLGIFLALCISPAFADSLSFKNVGVISGSGGNSGISLTSEITKVAFNGQDLGLTGQLDFNTGSLMGTLASGTFSGGTLGISIDTIGSIVFFSNFAGSVVKLSHDEYELMGTFSAIIDGVKLSGVTKQFFELESEDGKLSFEDLHGKTCITSSASVPEPGTLSLLGTGLIGLGGLVRRKIASL